MLLYSIVVDIASIQSCKTIRKTRNSKGSANYGAFTQEVELSFKPKNNNKDEIKFELFNEETNKQLSGELQFAEKWSKQLNERLKK